MSILIGLHVIRALERNGAITEEVQDRIFPIVAPAGIERFPFIIYETNGGNRTTTKDGRLYDEDSAVVRIVAKKHSEALRLANEARKALEGYTPDYDEFRVIGVSGISYNDEYVPQFDAYSVNLTIDFKTIDK